VAANGTPSLSPPDRNPALDAYIPVDTPYALFVSSAHPPNAHGLVEMAAGASGHPLRHGEIMICGNVGSLVRTDPHFKAAGRVLGQARFLGWVENDLLGALYAGCRAIILPKTLGGGSNLKTAEALASFRPIVATTRAFEGFEPFTGLPGVTIADEPDEFWCAVDGLLSGGDPVPPRPPEAMAGLLWSACLEPMVRAAESVVRERRR
jgi:glycosyltransferase involved in cell wall biosynthesis